MLETIQKLERGEEIRFADGVGSVLFTADDVSRRVADLGRQMAADLRDSVPVLIAILRGGFVFQCDLARAAAIPQEFDFLSVSRFRPEDKSRTAIKVLLLCQTKQLMEAWLAPILRWPFNRHVAPQCRA